MRAWLAFALLLFSSLGQAQLPTGSNNSLVGGLSGQDFLPVEQAYRLDILPRSDGSLRLYWQIAEGYYLYRHRFGFELAGPGEVPLAVELPPALERTDEYFGEVAVYYDNADILLQPGERVQRGTLEVRSQGCADAGLCYPPRKQFFEIDFGTGSVSEIAPPQGPRQTAGRNAATGSDWSSLPYMMLLAFLGGMILNLMPCVFPILSLKVLSFARGSDHDHRLHGWVYGAGVVASFVAVAAVLISLQAAGRAIGWGFQLQSPAFVIALAYLFLAMGLSLSGLVEFGTSIMNTGSGLAGRGGLSGSFFTGVLAVVVASPCTAPFMGTALGFAMTQPAVISLAIFAALGAGMAAPLLLLSYSTTLRQRMPRPGPWMDTLKQLLAFPLYASAIWLLWVAGRQTGVNSMALALGGALAVALGLWLWHLSGWRRGLALACWALAAASLGWRGLDQAPGGELASDDHVLFSEQRLQTLREEGRPVFVDVTADWCITCIANEQAVLFTDEIQAAFEQAGVVYMVADWTSRDPAIAAYLARHGRNGIPFYALYPAETSRPPLVLPQLLTRSTIRDALQSVSGEKPEVVATF